MAKYSTDDPIQFANISFSYLEAFETIWHSKFETTPRYNWKSGLFFYPTLHLLGVSFETALKGLLICKAGKAKQTHDLEKLHYELLDEELRKILDGAVANISVPPEFVSLNSDKPDEFIAAYRRHDIHVAMLNKNHNQPFATRYPTNNGMTMPDLIALKEILKCLLNQLNSEIENRDNAP